MVYSSPNMISPLEKPIETVGLVQNINWNNALVVLAILDASTMITVYVTGYGSSNDYIHPGDGIKLRITAFSLKDAYVLSEIDAYGTYLRKLRPLRSP